MCWRSHGQPTEVLLVRLCSAAARAGHFLIKPQIRPLSPCQDFQASHKCRARSHFCRRAKAFLFRIRILAIVNERLQRKLSVLDPWPVRVPSSSAIRFFSQPARWRPFLDDAWPISRKEKKTTVCQPRSKLTLPAASRLLERGSWRPDEGDMSISPLGLPSASCSG